MDEPLSAEVDDPKAPAPGNSKARWWILLGLLIYLLLTWKNSLLALIVGVIGDAGGGSLEIQERIMLLVLGANFPISVNRL